MLNMIDHPGPGSVPLVIAHGLFGSARNWNVIAKRLSDARRVVAVDMRNHGDSFHHPDHGYEAMATDLARVIEHLGGKADLLGHSMGGKAAMVLALTRPELLRHLIVADIAPVPYSHTQAHVVEALRAVDLSMVSRRSDADAQLKSSLPDAMLRAFLLQSLSLDDGAPRWRLNLAALADQMPRIIGFPEIDARHDGEMAFLRGGASDYVSDARLDALRGYFPKARILTMEGRGHWLHAEDPRGFEAMVREVLGT
ncbi:alpha/beta fold hydrolase [Halovulum dunhuangense]|uniref:Alpha/beta fold hydrolase n=2 Tax=Halovulum dunhuangense TaxID=1505036 RepID=A0A849L5N8_9RHOB|nr:alpha/beta fold hydrolase [Halovulum dunhuangense]NNU81573.1 alpha/beta fold hydrolase [Halovulum dunhuangense]